MALFTVRVHGEDHHPLPSAMNMASDVYSHSVDNALGQFAV